MGGVEISKKLVLVNSASTIFKSLLSLTVFLWVNQFFVEVLPAEEYQAFALVFPLTLFVPLLTMWVTSGIARYVTEAYARHDLTRVTEITSTMLPLTAGAGLLVLTVGSVLLVYIRPILNISPDYVDEARLMFAILLATAVVRVVVLPFMPGIEVRQKFVFRNFFALGLEVLRTALLVWLLFGVSTRVIWLVVVMIPIQTIDIGVSLTYSRRLVPELRFRRDHFRPGLVREICSFGGATMVARSAAVAREVCSPLFLAHGPGTAIQQALANWSYRLGANVESKFYPIVLGPLLTLQPALTAMHATSQDVRLKSAFLRMSRYLLWVFMFFGVPGIVFHRSVWDAWLDPEYALKVADGAVVLALLFAKGAFVFPQPILAQIALAKARPGQLAWRVAVIELSSVALAWFFVFQRGYGAIGVALATLIAAGVGTPLLHWPFALRLTGTTWSEFTRRTLVPGFLPPLIALPVWYLLWRQLEPTTWPGLIACGAAGGAVFALVLFGFCLEEHERADLRKVFSRLKRRLV